MYLLKYAKQWVATCIQDMCWLWIEQIVRLIFSLAELLKSSIGNLIGQI